MSKNDLILDVQAWLKDPSTYLFDEFRAQLVKNGVGEGDSIIKTIDVLRNETVETYKANKLQIGEEYLPKLKVLSILSYFYECQSYDLLKLSRLLSVDKQECMKLLLQASINRLITAKIDEEHNQIIIINSKVRQRETGPLTVKISKGKLTQIRQKNGDAENSINNLIKLVAPNQKQQAPSTQGIQGRYLHSHY